MPIGSTCSSGIPVWSTLRLGPFGLGLSVLSLAVSVTHYSWVGVKEKDFLVKDLIINIIFAVKALGK